MAPLPGVPSDILVQVGPLLLGYCINWGLFGVLCMQMYMYFLGFPGDLTGVKILVYTLFAVDTLQTALATHNGWHFLVSGWGDPSALIAPGWSWISVPLFTGVVSCTVQIFFAWRIKKISGSNWVAAPIVVVALVQGICAAISGIWFQIIDDVTKISFLDPTATVWLAGSAACDVAIAITMVILLRRSNTGFTGTDQLIRRLIRMTVETGALTAFAATMELILFLRWKDNNLHMIPALALSKLYTNTLIATLNSRNPQYRSSMRDTSEVTGGVQFRSTVMGSKITSADPNQSHHRGTKVQITTHQETHVAESEGDIAMDVMHDESPEYKQYNFDDGHSLDASKINSDVLTEQDRGEDFDGGHGGRHIYTRRQTDDLESGQNKVSFAPKFS